MRDYCAYFRGKKITLMGLGLLGRGVGVAKFMAGCGAELTVTDLKDEHALASSLARLKKYPNIRFVLGEHRLEDFRSADMVLKAAGVPLDSPCIAEARKYGALIKMDASLFAELALPGVTLIGVTGTRGKSTTTQMIYEVLVEWCMADSGRRTVEGGRAGSKRPTYQVPIASPSHPPRVFLGGNVRGVATLPLLKQVRSGDIVVLELDSWQLQGFGEVKLSPHVAVFTTFFDDHLNYYQGNRGQYLEDKAQIFLHQTRQAAGEKQQATGNVFVVGTQAMGVLKKQYPTHAKRAIEVRSRELPNGWKLSLPGEHNRANAACALAVADALNVSRAVSRRVFASLRGLPGRLELVRTIRGIKIYNDTCATTPDATIAALRALGGRRQQKNQKPAGKNNKSRKLVLIFGGADKGLDMPDLIKEIPKYCKSVVLLAGTGTSRIMQQASCSKHHARTMSSEQHVYCLLHVACCQELLETNLRSACNRALSVARRGDAIIFSPAFASFGMFKNEYDRGAQFNKIVARMR